MHGVAQEWNYLLNRLFTGENSDPENNITGNRAAEGFSLSGAAKRLSSGLG
jgi:hypothetical protein